MWFVALFALANAVDIHPHAELAAEAAEAAGAQGRFWDYHDMLYEHQHELEFEHLLGYAGELGLDVERFVRELELGLHASRVLEDMVSAEASGARATPTFFVRDRRHVGPHDAATPRASCSSSRCSGTSHSTSTPSCSSGKPGSGHFAKLIHNAIEFGNWTHGR